MTDATEMSKYDGMEYEELVAAAQFLWMENAKLRELAKAAWGCVKSQVSCEDCRIVACGCTLATAMRECGIEAK